MAGTERNHSTKNPLHTAASCGEIEKVKKILKANKCSVNIENDKRQTTLHLACLNGHLDIVDVLVNDFDANIGAIDREGNTPLSLAAGSGHIQIVLLLILISIFGRKCGNIVRVPISHNVCKIDGDSKVFENLVFDCHGDCKPLAVEKIVALKFSDLFASTGNENFIPLLLATCLGLIDLVELFARDHGSDLNMRGFFGLSLLHCACFGGHSLLVEKLISHYHVDKQSKDKTGSSILHYAALGGNDEIILLLKTTFGMDCNVEMISEKLRCV